MNVAAHELLPWQTGIWQRLAPVIAGGRMPHAMMLTGAPGIGKRHLARLLGMALLCRRRDAGSLPCGNCNSCVPLAAGAHPDFRELTPEEDRKTISVDQVRAFSRTCYLRPQAGQARAALIYPVERLHASAANALLKTLEEPPAGSHMLLISEQPSAVIATIRSRCQTLRVPLPDEQALGQWLQSQPEPVTHALSLARGAPLRALTMLESGVVDLQGQWLEDLSALMASRQGPGAIAQRWHEHPLLELLDWLYLVLGDVLKLALGAPAHALANQAQQENLRALAARMQTEKLRRALPRLIKARRMLDSNADKLLMLEQLMITLWACRQPEVRRAG